MTPLQKLATTFSRVVSGWIDDLALAFPILTRIGLRPTVTVAITDADLDDEGALLPTWWQSIERTVRVECPRRLQVRLPERHCLELSLGLPKTPGLPVRDALTYRLPELVPLDPQSLRWGFLSESAREGQTHVHLAVAKKNVSDPMLEKLRGVASTSAVALIAPTLSDRPIVLVEVSARDDQSPRAVLSVVAGIAVWGFVLLAAMFTAQHRLQARTAEAEKEIRTLRDQQSVASVSALREMAKAIDEARPGPAVYGSLLTVTQLSGDIEYEQLVVGPGGFALTLAEPVEPPALIGELEAKGYQVDVGPDDTRVILRAAMERNGVAP